MLVVVGGGVTSSCTVELSPRTGCHAECADGMVCSADAAWSVSPEGYSGG